MIIELPINGPFSFKECLHYLSRSPLECLHLIDAESVIKPLRIGEDIVLIELSCHRQSVLQLRFLENTKISAKNEVIEYVKDWFDLKINLNEFYHVMENDPLLGSLIQKYDGLRLIGIPDLFEALCWAIVGQQVNLNFAYQLKQRLAERYGTSVKWKDKTVWLFPRPEQIQGVDIEELCELKLTRAKANTIREVANLIASGNLSREKLLSMRNFDQAERSLVSIKGIGPWTAHYVRMRCLRDPSAFPIGDAGLQNAVKHLLGMERKPTTEELQQLFARWSGWEAYATFYLWRSLSDN